MQNHARPLDMPQKIMPQPCALAGTLDEAGQIRHDETALARPYHAQVRGKRGEMVIGNFWLCRRNHREQGGFSHAREAHQPHIRDGLEL